MTNGFIYSCYPIKTFVRQELLPGHPVSIPYLSTSLYHFPSNATLFKSTYINIRTVTYINTRLFCFLFILHMKTKIYV